MERGKVFCWTALILATAIYLAYSIYITEWDPPQEYLLRTMPLPKLDKRIRRFPQALIIGSKKCGTTTLRHFLKRNSKIVSAKSECHFFDKHFVKGLQWYLNKMPKSSDDQITIEKTPRYFYHPYAAKRIHEWNSEIKLICIVCNPVRRLVSDYAHTLELRRKLGRTNPSFTDAVFDDHGMVNATYAPVEVSTYVKHLRRWYSLFSKSQLLILDGDGFLHNPVVALNRIETFLGLEPVITPKDFIFSEEKGFLCLNNSGIPKCMSSSQGREHPYVSPEQLKTLYEYFEPYNHEFYELSGIHFDWIRGLSNHTYKH